MGHRPCDWLKGADHRFHQVNLTGERHSFRFADRRLSIQLRSQRTPLSQQHIEALNQAMTWHAFVLGRRMMPSQSFHLLAFAFLDRRVIPDQIPCHDGLLGTASTLRLLLALSLQFCCDLGLHHFTKVPQPECYHCCCFPWGFRQKAAQSCQTRPIGNLTQRPRERSSALTEHQPQQYDHQVLVLGLGEQLPKPLGKVAYMFIQTYNGNWHRTPPWFQGWIFFFLIPHGVLSCHFPFQKCKHRVIRYFSV